MSAKDATRALLDELMGKNRNAPMGSETVDNFSWKDDNVCKYYICGWCPVRHLEGTKCDLRSGSDYIQCGEHNEIAKHQFSQEKWSSQKPVYSSYRRLLADLEGQLQKRTRGASAKLDEVNSYSTMELPPALNPELRRLNEQIQLLEKRIEEFGEEGKVREAEDMTHQLEILKTARNNVKPNKLNGDSLQKLFRNSKPCPVCGGLQNQDPEKLKMHNAGKIHTAFMKLPTAVKEVEDLFTKHANDESDDESSSKSRGRDRRDRRSRDRGRDRDRDRSRRDRRDRDRDYDRRSDRRRRDRSRRY